MAGWLTAPGAGALSSSSLAVVGVSTILLSLTFHILFLVFMFGVVTSVAASGSSITNTGAILARWFRRKRATVVGITAGGASAGGLILVPFAMYLLQATDSWRVTWIALGGIVLVLGIPLGWMFIHESPAQRGLLPDGDGEPQAGGPNRREQVQGPLDTDSWTQSYKSLPIWQMSGSYIVCGATTFLLSVHFVPFVIEKGISPSTAATIFGVMMGLNAIGATGAGILSDYFGRKNLLALVYFTRGLRLHFAASGAHLPAGGHCLLDFRRGRRVLLDCNRAPDHVPDGRRIRH